MVTFVRWNSPEMMQALDQKGLKTELLSVAKKHYDDMCLAVLEERINGPSIKILIDELLKLKIIKDKVDHPQSGSKDLADATCGAIYNAVSLTKRREAAPIEVHTYGTLARRDYAEQQKRIREEGGDTRKTMEKEKPAMPEDLRELLDRMSVL